MAVFHSFQLLYMHPWRIPHLIIGCTGAIFIFFSPIYGQEIVPEINSFRTALAVGSIGDWDDPATWEVWDGNVWTSASSTPDRNNDVFLEKGNEVRLRQTEEANNLYLFADTDAGKKLDLQVYDLDVYGALK